MKTLSLLLLAALVGSLSPLPSLAADEKPSPGTILGISHMAVKVSDVDKAVAFYHDFLGLEEHCRLKRDDGTLSMIAFKLSDEQVIELFPGLQPGEERLYQYAYIVDDAEALRARLAAKGLKVPASVKRGQLKNLGFTLTDPSGYTLEFVEYTPIGWTRRDQGKFLPDSRVSEHITHGGIATRTPEASIEFYAKALGFTEGWRGSKDGKVTAWVNMNIPGSGDYVELMLEKDVTPHFCLSVPDIEKAKARLESSPYRARYTLPLEIRTGRNQKRQLNLYDPDGTRIELMEPITIDGRPAASASTPLPGS